jgi:DNA mismatch repair protein MLH1
MFYNTPTRLSALRSSSEEYARILDVVTKYAVHNPKVSFLCRKVCDPEACMLVADYIEQAGSPTPELSTSATSDVGQAIRLLYGHSIGKELLHVESSCRTGGSSSRDTSAGDPDDSERWSAEAYCTSPNYQAKKTVFLLFINRKFQVRVWVI